MSMIQITGNDEFLFKKGKLFPNTYRKCTMTENVSIVNIFLKCMSMNSCTGYLYKRKHIEEY